MFGLVEKGIFDGLGKVPRAPLRLCCFYRTELDSRGMQGLFPDQAEID